MVTNDTISAEQALAMFNADPEYFLENTPAGQRIKKKLREEPKSGLLNHETLLIEGVIAIESLKRSERFIPLSIIYIDIDDFRNINGEFDHDEGDLAIKRTGQAIRENIRSYDRAGRLGDRSDEFAIILPYTSKAEAMEIATRICNNIPATGKAKVSLSFGVLTCYIRIGINVKAEKLINWADRIMKKEKRDKKSQNDIVILV